MRQLTTALALATALLAAACTNPERRDTQPYRADTIRPLPQRGPGTSDPAMSPGASDSFTSGSASNAASGSSATQQSAPIRR